VTVRVAIADDQHLIRAGLRGIIEAAPDLTVVAEAATGEEAVEVARDRVPDVMLMDIRMPGMDGLEATRRVVADTSVRVVVLTTFDLDEYIWSAIDAGASGFLLKDTPALDLQQAVRIIADGDALLSPTITRRVIDRLAHEAAGRPRVGLPGPPPLGPITHRERDVLDLVAHGLSNAEIAQQLHVSTGTVKTHVSSLLTKLDARDRIQLVILALTSP
jgi:DNA-binding NarL/FixJ family response regulator